MAEDLASDTFVRGWKAFRSKKEIENPQAFLYQIARNLVTDFYRKKGTANTVSINDCKEMSDPQIDIEKEASILSDMGQVRTALSNLNENYQNVIIWYYLESLSVSEIAKIMDKSEEAIRITIHRALKALRNEMDISAV